MCGVFALWRTENVKLPARLSAKSKALAGALAGLLASTANHLSGGGSIEAIATSGSVVLEIAVSMAVGYALVYWFPANEAKP